MGPDIVNMSQTEIKKVTVFSTANPEHAIASLRIISPLSQAGIEINWCMPDQEYMTDLISGSDLVIIQRDFPRYVNQYYRIHRDAHQMRIPVIFEIDDLLWELPNEHPDIADHFYTDALMPMMFAAWNADGISVPSSGLKGYLSWINPNTFILPNYLNTKIWSLENPVEEENKSISIVYIGGASHLPDLEMIAEVISNILDHYQGQVKFVCWGVQPPPRLNDNPLVEWNSLTPGDYAEFAAKFNQQNFDIYVAPLKASLFNRCKSSIKVFEYTALGVPGVASNLEPYAEVITPGVTGLLAGTNDQWEEHLKSLIERPDLRLQIASQAQALVQSDWLLRDNYQQWLYAYEKILDSYAPKEDVPQKLDLMKSISNQTAYQMQQLHTELNFQQAEIAQLKESLGVKAARVLKSMFAQMSPRETKIPNQEMLDEP
jgi:glycosyltransferase involved in cell wall biosynthesis